jgi:hypothetical protein
MPAVIAAAQPLQLGAGLEAPARDQVLVQPDFGAVGHVHVASRGPSSAAMASVSTRTRRCAMVQWWRLTSISPGSSAARRRLPGAAGQRWRLLANTMPVSSPSWARPAPEVPGVVPLPAERRVHHDHPGAQPGGDLGGPLQLPRLAAPPAG